MEKLPITAKGLAALEVELKERQQVRRPSIIDAIAEARAHGDLSENAEYHAAKENQSLNEGRIQELESMIARADIIDVSKLSGDKVKFGATVKLVDEDTEEEKTYQIVGDPEADVKSGRVSISSPVARALIGKSVGDSVSVTTPGGGKSYEIVDGRVPLSGRQRPGTPRATARSPGRAPAAQYPRPWRAGYARAAPPPRRRSCNPHCRRPGSPGPS